MSRMIDALRHKREPENRSASVNQQSAGAKDEHVLASLGYGADDSDSGGSSPWRTAIGIVLVLITGVIVWQVAASNHLVSFGPLSSLLETKKAVERPVQPAAVPSPTSQSPNVPQAKPTVRAAEAVKPTAPSAKPVETQKPQPAPVVVPPITQAPQTRPQPVQAQPPVLPPVPAQAPAQARAQTPPSSTPGPGVTWAGGSGAPSATAASNAEASNFKMALYYQRTGDFEKALVHYRAVLEANELNAEAHNNLGLLYQDKGLYEDAIREFRRATAIDTRYVKAHNNLGVALLRSGKADAAVSEFRWIVAQDARNVEGLTNLALALKASGHPVEARDNLQRAIQVDSRYANAHYNLALVLEEAGELSRAIEHYEQFLSLAGADTAVLATEVRGRVLALREKMLKK